MKPATTLTEALKIAHELKEQVQRQSVLHIKHLTDGGMEIIAPNGDWMTYHPNETGKLFHQNDSFVRGVFGPYGSGKTTKMLIEIVKRTCAMPRWSAGNRRRAKWAIVRNTTGELESTTLQSWLGWFGGLELIKKRQKPILNYEYVFNDGDGLCELELLFIPLDRPDQIKKLKSLELTGVYLNELAEIPKAAFEHFTGRVNRYPPPDRCEYWSGIIFDTNPPDDDHWIHHAFEEKPVEGWKLYKQPPGLVEVEGEWEVNPNADNINHLSKDYYLKLAMGKTKEFIKVFCLGQYGTVSDGQLVYPEYNDDLHSVDTLLANPDLPIHLGWDGGLCYSDDTEVLTDNGWKLFKDVDEKVDLAATRNPENGEMEYTSINFKTEYDYDGELLEWASTEVNFCVTPEHRVPFTYRTTPNKVHFKSAEWLAEHHGGHHYVDLCSTWKPDFDEDIKCFGMDTETFCAFMGIYLSEGSLYQVGESYRITVYQKEKKPRMDEVLSSIGMKWSQNERCWRFTNNDLGRYLKQFGTQGKRYVPREIKDMPPSLIKVFIDFYIQGDGSIRKRKNGSVAYLVYTTSPIMKDDFQELAQKAGWNSSIVFRNPRKSIIIEDGVPRVIQNNGDWLITIKKRATRAELLKRNFRRVPYKGKIYCLNVPYHTLYIRRNGKPSWNGNTPSCVVCQLSPRGQLRALKEYTTERMGIRTFVKNVVLPGLAQDFKGLRIGISVADPSMGAGDQIMEELSALSEINEAGIETEKARTNNVDPRLGAVRFFLNTMIDGQPAFVLSRAGCPVLRKGFLRDYYYKKLRLTGEERWHKDPYKNFASGPQDDLQYISLELAPDQIAKDKRESRSPVNMWNPPVRF